MGFVLISLTVLLAGASLGAALLWAWCGRTGKRDRQALQAEMSALRLEVNRIAEELKEREATPPAGAPIHNGFNLNRRAEAVRRLRAGLSLDNVASATRWSAAEIALLQKVEQLAEQGRSAFAL